MDSRFTEEQKREIELSRARPMRMTYRPTVDAMEERMFTPVPVLDHGFVRLIDYMGDEGAIVQAARVSYGKGTKKRSADRGLLRYLMRHRHTTPFEMCEIKLHMKLPIFVARQLIRHRTANVNEYSGRYSILAKEFYVPDAEHMGVQSTTNRQGRGESISPEQAQEVLLMLFDEAERDYANYQFLLNDDGEGNAVREGDPMIARELARMGLGLNFYTEWYWKIDVHNLMHMLGLRMDSHAQYEIRCFANPVGEMLEAWMPNVWEAFIDYRMEASFFSKPEMEIVKGLIGISVDWGGDEETREAWETALLEAGVSKREAKAFWAKVLGA